MRARTEGIRLATVLCSACLAALPAALPAAAFGQELSIATVDGEEFAADLVRIADGALVVKAKDGEKPIPFASLGSAEFGAEAAPGGGAAWEFILRNGDTVLATLVSGTDEKLSVNSAVLGKLDLPTRAIKGIVLAPRGTRDKARFKQILAAQSKDEDQVWLAKGDVLQGVVEKYEEKDLTVDVGGQKRPIPAKDVFGVVLAALDPFQEPAKLLAVLRLRDGSAVTGDLAGYADRRLTLKSVFGNELGVPEKDVSRLTFKNGRQVFLSDLPVANAEQRPLVKGAPLVWGYRLDACVGGGPMAIKGRRYEKGLGTHSFCSLRFDLKGEYIRLLADLGYDASAPAAEQSASYKVLADGKEVAAGEMKRGDPAVRLNLDVAGAGALTLVTDFGPDGDELGDSINWANARAIRKP